MHQRHHKYILLLEAEVAVLTQVLLKQVQVEEQLDKTEIMVLTDKVVKVVHRLQEELVMLQVLHQVMRLDF